MHVIFVTLNDKNLTQKLLPLIHKNHTLKFVAHFWYVLSPLNANYYAAPSNIKYVSKHYQCPRKPLPAKKFAPGPYFLRNLAPFLVIPLTPPYEHGS